MNKNIIEMDIDIKFVSSKKIFVMIIHTKYIINILNNKIIYNIN